MNPALQQLVDKLNVDAAVADPWKLINAYIAVDAAADAAICDAKARVLKSAIAWGGEGQALAARSLESTRRLAAIGLRISERCELSRRDDQEDGRLQQVIHIALANYGSTIRWSSMMRGAREDPDYPAIHALYRRAERLELALAPSRIVRDGTALVLNAESHYLRDLLLPLFCHEALDPQQIEVVDNWLWTWVGDFRLTRRLVDTQPRLWIDLEGKAGVSLRQFMPEGADVRHLVLTKMEQHLDDIVEAFHAGRIPGSGCATAFPIEAHAGVLDHARTVWNYIQDGAPKRRSERVKHTEPIRVEGVIGLPDILAAAGARSKSKRNWMHLHDESEGGAGIIVDRSLWEQVWHGDLIGIRVESAGRPRVGVVVRKFPIEGRSFAVGVEWLAREPRQLAMRENTDDRSARDVPALYVAGEDESGRRDAIVLDESHFLAETRYQLACGDRVFEIRLDRVLRRGRGWVAAGFEIVGVRKGAFLEAVAA